MNPLCQHGAYDFLPYTPPTSATPSPLKVNHTSTWTYCGPILAPTALPPSLHTWSAAAVSSPTELLHRLQPLLSFLRAFLLEANVHHYWLTLRATTPTAEYNTPRWHIDDDFFSTRPFNAQAGEGSKEVKGKEKAKTGWKLCTPLLGPPTLFLPLPRNAQALTTLRTVQEREAQKREHACTSIRCLSCFDRGAAARLALADLLAGEGVVQAAEGEVVFFRTGAEEGAVHSEPRCGVDRVFVNVVPGAEGELRRLMGQFGMGFPRAWSLGVPLDVNDGLDGLGNVVLC